MILNQRLLFPAHWNQGRTGSQLIAGLLCCTGNMHQLLLGRAPALTEQGNSKMTYCITSRNGVAQAQAGQAVLIDIVVGRDCL